MAGLAALGVLCLIAEALVLGGMVSPLVLARPSDVGLAVVELIREESLMQAFLATFAVTLAAGATATAIGIPAGFLLYRFRNLGRAYESWFAALFAAPMVLLYPLFLVIIGRNFMTIFVMGTITGAIPIILNTRVGLASVPGPLVNVGVSFNCSGGQQFFKVLFPAAVPDIFTGIRLGLIYALVNIIGIEFLINFGGLGRVVSDMYDRFEIPGMYAAIGFIVVVSASVFAVLARIEKRIRPV
ncbi:MAG: ABC transporter permease subunit [Hyphomicrobiales bacterium]|nr:ABC transporter permease subunit [Hyphomicrobiales bacterium]